MANNQRESVAIQKYIKNMQKEIDECTNKIHALKKEIMWRQTKKLYVIIYVFHSFINSFIHSFIRYPLVDV